MKIKTSYSQSKTFSDCQRRWQLSRKYEPLVKSKALMEGSAFHLVLEKFYQKKMGLKKGLHILDEVEKELTEHLKLVGHQDQQDKFFTRINSLRAVIDRYYHHILAPDSKRFDVEEVELPVEMFINKGKSNELHVRGFVDAIWKDKKTYKGKN